MSNETTTAQEHKYTVRYIKGAGTYAVFDGERMMELEEITQHLSERDALRQLAQVLVSTLECVRDYAFNPESDRVNAGEMSPMERLMGAGGHADFGLDEAARLGLPTK